MEKCLGTCSGHQFSAFRPSPPPPEPFAISANELSCEYLGCSCLSPQLTDTLKEKMKANESLQNLPASGFLHKKRFLVFDQCGNKTTLLSPAYLTWCWHDLNHKNGITAGNNATLLSIARRDESENNNNTHEDTEEIDALLFSEYDNDDDDDDDEDETSTGRSPSFQRRECEEDEGEEEEVTSSARSTKRIKLSESSSSN